MKGPKGPFFCSYPNCTCWFDTLADLNSHHKRDHEYSKRQKKRLGVGWREIIKQQKVI